MNQPTPMQTIPQTSIPEKVAPKQEEQVRVRMVIENAVKLDAETPIPIQYGNQTYFSIFGKKYLPFLGKDDILPNLLLEARLTSTTQSACLSTIAESTVGNGLTVGNIEIPDAAWSQWLNLVNNNGQSFKEICKSAIDGYGMQGNQFIEIKKGTIQKQPFLKIYLHNMQYCRLAEPDQNDYPESVYISRSFAKKGYNSRYVEKALQIPLWSPNLLDQTKCWKNWGDGTMSTMLHLKNEISGIDYYGMPASIAGLRYQVLEGKSAQFNIDNFENNLILGGMLIFKSAMTQTEAQANAQNIMATHVGAGKVGRIAVISSESGLKDVDFTPYETQKEGSYIELDQRVEQKIISANNWDSTLAGINKSTRVGSGAQLIRSIWDVKEATLLKPLRTKLIEKVVTPIMKIYAEVFNKPEVAKYECSFSTSMPFSFMGEVDPTLFMKVNEARLLSGLDSDPAKEEVYLSQMKTQTNIDVQDKSDPEAGADNN